MQFVSSSGILHAAAEEVLQDTELGILFRVDWVEEAEIAPSQDVHRLSREARSASNNARSAGICRCCFAGKT